MIETITSTPITTTTTTTTTTPLRTSSFSLYNIENPFVGEYNKRYSGYKDTYLDVQSSIASLMYR
jgi:hypothetical protein